MRRCTSILAAAMIAVGAMSLPVSAPEASAQTLVVPLPKGSSVRDLVRITGIGKVVQNQGQVIYSDAGPDKLAQCTLGYISPGNTYGYAAAHCFPGKVGAPVYDGQMRRIGRVTDVWTAGGRDVARIGFGDNVFGINPLTGDKVLSWRDVRVGDPICHYGNSTRAPQCSRVWKVEPYKVSSGNNNTRFGDSGGPAWIPGKGYIGVVSTVRVPVTPGTRVASETVISTIR